MTNMITWATAPHSMYGFLPNLSTVKMAMRLAEAESTELSPAIQRASFRDAPMKLVNNRGR